MSCRNSSSPILENLTITGNDLSGIDFTNLISPQGYLFNEDGISFFDGTGTEIFATLTLSVKDSPTGILDVEADNETSGKGGGGAWPL